MNLKQRLKVVLPAVAIPALAVVYITAKSVVSNGAEMDCLARGYHDHKIDIALNAYCIARDEFGNTFVEKL